MEETEVIIQIFNPTKEKDLRIDYPELAEIDEFKGMEPKFVKFCYYVGCRTSPLFNLPKEEKVIKAIELLWGTKVISKIPRVKAIYDGDFPDDITKGILRMNRFNPENRLQARIISDYIFNQMKKLVVVSDKELADMDFENRNRYATLLNKVQKDMPELIRNMESGFGVTVVEKKNPKKTVLVSMKDLG